MSDQFYTGRSKRTGGAFSINMKDGAAIAKRLRQIEGGGRTAIQRTVSDFASRAPAWISKEIRKHYSVDTQAINEAGPIKKRGASSVEISGKTVEGMALVYRGRTLTPVHFKLSPKTRPTTLNKKMMRVPGQAIAGAGDVAMINPPKKYNVKATIIKGQRVKLPPGTFIAQGNGGVSLPFQRVGEGRMPIEAVRTLSVPQMIEGRARGDIEATLGEKLTERFDHHINQTMKKLT